jgi:cation:H+ antiporter
MDALPLPVVAAIFLAMAALVAVAGVRLTAIVDRIADRTGLGEAVAGGLLLGMATSLSGTVVSITAALEGRASLAFANGIGGIAAQTAFLAVGDLLYRRANLEHAAADLAALFQAALLMLMLSLPLLAFAGPEASVWGVHPVSALLLAVYLVGARSTAGIRESPMWRPVLTRVTRTDLAEREHPGAPSTPALALRFAGLAVVLGLAGIVLARAGGRIADETGLTETAVGALMTAVATSLPELVTTLAAVRRGAVQLAVGGIIGGNTFDVLFVVLSDISYRQGSIYHAIAPGDLFWLAVGMAMTAVLLIGLIVRERTGPGGIGRESVALLAIYGGAVVVQAMLV